MRPARPAGVSSLRLGTALVAAGTPLRVRAPRPDPPPACLAREWRGFWKRRRAATSGRVRPQRLPHFSVAGDLMQAVEYCPACNPWLSVPRRRTADPSLPAAGSSASGWGSGESPTDVMPGLVHQGTPVVRRRAGQQPVLVADPRLRADARHRPPRNWRATGAVTSAVALFAPAQKKRVRPDGTIGPNISGSKAPLARPARRRRRARRRRVVGLPQDPQLRRRGRDRNTQAFSPGSSARRPAHCTPEVEAGVGGSEAEQVLLFDCRFGEVYFSSRCSMVLRSAR